MSTNVELQAERHEMLVRVQAGVIGARDAIDWNDCIDIITWCNTIQAAITELVASTVLDIRNKGD